jgi:hypothetical protein
LAHFSAISAVGGFGRAIAGQRYADDLAVIWRGMSVGRTVLRRDACAQFLLLVEQRKKSARSRIPSRCTIVFRCIRRATLPVDGVVVVATAGFCLWSWIDMKKLLIGLAAALVGATTAQAG